MVDYVGLISRLSGFEYQSPNQRETALCILNDSRERPAPWVDSIIGSAGDAYSLSVGSNPIRPVSKMRIFPFQPDALPVE